MNKSEWLEKCADVLIEYGSIPYFAITCAQLYQRENHLSDEDLLDIDPSNAAIEIMGGDSARTFH